MKYKLLKPLVTSASIIGAVMGAEDAAQPHEQRIENLRAAETNPMFRSIGICAEEVRNLTKDEKKKLIAYFKTNQLPVQDQVEEDQVAEERVEEDQVEEDQVAEERVEEGDA